MKVYFQPALLTALAFLLWLPAFALGQVPEVDSITLNKWIAERKDLVLIDVGTPGDFAEGHIPGSISLPLGASFEGKKQESVEGENVHTDLPDRGADLLRRRNS